MRWCCGTCGRRSRRPGAGIAARAGLTRATVSRLVAELIDLGLVSETGPAAGQGQGRPATQLALTGRHVLAIGAEINVDYLAVLAVNLANREVDQERRAFDAPRAGPASSVRELAQMCDACLTALPTTLGGRGRVLAGLGIAIPGLIDEASATVSCAPNLGWDDFPVLPELSRELRGQARAITIGNDANRAAIAEYRVGSHAGTQNLVYVTGEVGIGGGMIVHGQPLSVSRKFWPSAWLREQTFDLRDISGLSSGAGSWPSVGRLLPKSHRSFRRAITPAAAQTQHRGKREGDQRDPMASRPRVPGTPATTALGAARQPVTQPPGTPPGHCLPVAIHVG